MKLKVKKIIDELDLEILVEGDLTRMVEGGYCCDLLSNVMARAEKNDIWLTLQGHQNIVAVASLTNVSAILVVEDFDVEAKTIEKAKSEEINILRSSLSAYQLAGKLFELGIK